MKKVSAFFFYRMLKVMFLRILESIWGVMQRNEEMAFRGRCCTIPGQRFNNNS